MDDSMRLDNLIKTYKCRLGNETDMVSEYYLSLLRDDLFVQLLCRLNNATNFDKESIYLDTVNNGFVIYDLKNALKFLTNDEKPHRSLSLPKSVLNSVDNDLINRNLFNDKQGSKVTCSYTINDFYVHFNYEASEAVQGNQFSQIIFKSNLFSEAILIDILKKRFGSSAICLLNEGTVNLIIADQFDSVEDYCNLPQISYLESYRKYKSSGLIITAQESVLWDIYYYLRPYIKTLEDVASSKNLWQQTRTILASFDEISLNIPLYRLCRDVPEINWQALDRDRVLSDFFKEMPINVKKKDLQVIFKLLNEFDRTTLKDIVLEVLKMLNPSEMAVLLSRFFDGEGKTLEATGEKYGCTRERIRQIEVKALKKIRSSRVISLKNKIIRTLYLHADYDTFITEEQLDRLGINRQYAAFIDKAWGEVKWSSIYRVCFFNGELDLVLEKELNELPINFTKSEMQDYSANISSYIDADISPEEISVLISRRYNAYGDFIVKGKIQLRTILTWLMEQYFPNGMDIYDSKNIQFLREKASEHFGGIDLSESDRAIQARLQSFCTLIGRGQWKLEANELLINKDLQQKILKHIEEYNSPVIPVQSILESFSTLLNEADINNKYHLQSQLKKFLPAKYSINRDYIYKNDAGSLYEVVEEFIRKSITIVTKKDLLRNFPGLSDIVIQQAVANTKIVNMNGYYVHLDNLNITNDELITLNKSINDVLSDGEIHNSRKLFNQIRSVNSGLFSRIGINHYLQCYYLIHELFPDDYSYNRPFVAKLGVKVINGEAQVLECISERQELNISDVREIAHDIGYIIDRYIEFVDDNNDLIIFKNQNSIATLQFAGIYDDMFCSIDEIISSFLMGRKYASLRSFQEYWRLPKLNIIWNEWVLYSVIGKYSTCYKAVASSKVLNDAVPFVAEASFNIAEIDFSDIEDSVLKDEILDDETIDELLDYSDLE